MFSELEVISLEGNFKISNRTVVNKIDFTRNISKRSQIGAVWVNIFVFENDVFSVGFVCQKPVLLTWVNKKFIAVGAIMRPRKCKYIAEHKAKEP